MTAYLWTLFVCYILTVLGGLSKLGNPNTITVTWTPAERAVRVVIGLGMLIWTGYLLFR